MNGTATTDTVEVLLATYNGERYLAEQLDSLLGQSFDHSTILIADDASSDSTPAILRHYAAAHSGRIRLLPAAGHLTASGNFARLIDAASADYIFFCDQDDVWLPEKVAISLKRMKQLTADSPPDSPLLVHTDLAVVDAGLGLLGASFFDYVGSDPARNSLAALLMGNIVTGCTALANRALYELARPVPRDALMFDHWLALVAAAMGRISCIHQPTVLYRQHGANLIGADRVGTATFVKRIERTALSDKTLRVLGSYSRHAEILLERYADRLDPDSLAKANAMARIWSRPRMVRLASLFRAGLFKPTLIANFGLALLVLRDGKPGGHGH